MDPADLATLIIDECRALGFHRAGIIPVEPAARHHLYERWASSGYAGEMTWLAEPAARAARRDVREILAETRTVVVVALAHERLVPLRTGRYGRIARYALGDDYHLVLKGKLAALATKISAAVGSPVISRACVDTAHVLERDLAERAGLGFVGKNTLLIAPGLGSYVLLGELLLDAAVEPPPAEPVRKRCGTCRACLDACPTGAFVDEMVLDARRCISYLTIELRGPIPRQLRPLVGTRVFGCDVCQEVCPFNAAEHAEPAPELAARAPDRAVPSLIALLGLGAAQYRRFVRRSALRRVNRAQLLRNACVALGNAGDASAIPALRRALAEPPLVREHAAWALALLGDRDFLAAHADPVVRAELEFV